MKKTTGAWTDAQERKLLKTVKKADSVSAGLKMYSKVSGRGLPGVQAKYYTLASKDFQNEKKNNINNNLPFEINIEDVQLTRTKNNPQTDALRRTILSLEKGQGFVYPKKYHGIIQGIVAKLHKEKNGAAFGTVQVNTDTRKIGRII